MRLCINTTMSDLWPCPWKKNDDFWLSNTHKIFGKRWTKAKTKPTLSFKSRTNSFDSFDWRKTVTNTESMEAWLPIWNCLRNTEKNENKFRIYLEETQTTITQIQFDDKRFPIRIALTYTSRIDTKLFVFDRILLSKKKTIIYRQQLGN